METIDTQKEKEAQDLEIKERAGEAKKTLNSKYTQDLHGLELLEQWELECLNTIWEYKEKLQNENDETVQTQLKEEAEKELKVFYDTLILDMPKSKCDYCPNEREEGDTGWYSTRFREESTELGDVLIQGPNVCSHHYQKLKNLFKLILEYEDKKREEE